MPHYCRICGRSRPNERFSAKGHEHHICVCFMYTRNAAKQKWFDRVRLVVWGPSSRLLAGDKELQAAIKTMMKDGVEVQACVVCANMYGVAPALRKLGIEVKGMGKPLSEMLQTGWKVITF